MPGLASNPASALSGGANTNAPLSSGGNLLKNMLGDTTDDINLCEAQLGHGVVDLGSAWFWGFLKIYHPRHEITAAAERHHVECT